MAHKLWKTIEDVKESHPEAKVTQYDSTTLILTYPDNSENCLVWSSYCQEWVYPNDHSYAGQYAYASGYHD